MKRFVEEGPGLCPYCGEGLKTIPQRKKKCPSCKRAIYVKSTPSNRDKRLMTEAQAKEAEERWIEYHIRQESLSVLQSFEFNERDLEREKSLSAGSDPEAVVALLTRFTASTKNLPQRSLAFRQLAIYADKEGRPFQELLSEAARSELLREKQIGVVEVEILTGGPDSSCAECEAQAGKVLPVDEALHLMPLPCRDCTSVLFSTRPGYCGCTYIPIIKKG